MAVNYVYANPVGYFTETQSYKDEERKYKVSMLRANCLWAELFFFKDSECREMEQFVGYCADLAHLRRKIKDGDLWNRDDYHFYASAMDTKTWNAVAELVKAGKRVSIENHGNGLYDLPVQTWNKEEWNVKDVKRALDSGFNVQF